MKPGSALFRLLILLALAIPVHPGHAADPATPFQDTTTAAVSPDTLKSKIQEVEASTTLDAETKGKLTELYRKALAFQEKANSNNTAVETFRQARETAPQETRAILDQLEEAERTLPEVTPDVTDQTPLAEIEQELIKEKANRSAMEIELAEIEKQLQYEADRPTAASRLLSEAKQRQEAIAAELKLPAPADESPELASARKWLLESESLKVRTDILMLDQEILSQSMRIELLEARRNKAARSLEHMDKRIKLLEGMVSERRLADAEQAKSEAEKAEREALGKHPLVQKLAEDNAALSEELTSLAADLDRISAEDEAANKEAKRIDDVFRSTRQKLELAGLSQALGRVLLEQRRSLPGPGIYRKQARAREQKTTEAGLRLIQFEEQRRNLRSIPDYVTELTTDLADETAREIHAQLTELVTSRRALLDKAAALNQAYLRSLGELDFAQRQLLDTVEAYNAYLDERLLWIRSISAPNLEMLQAVPGQIIQLLSPTHWRGVLKTLIEQLTHSPVFLPVTLLLAVLLLRTRKMRSALVQTGKKIGRPRTDHYTYTLKALTLTVLLAAPWPVLAWVSGWQLGASLDAADFTKAVSQGLLWVAPTFFFLLTFRVLCASGGLAEAHFRWPAERLRTLRRELYILLSTFIPASFIAVLIIKYDSAIMGGGVGRFAFVLLLLTLAYFFYRVLDPKRGALQTFMARNPKALYTRLRYLWPVLAVAIPVSLAVLVIVGYLYTAGTLLRSLVDTLWLVLILTVIHQLIVRWLQMTRRKLAFDAAVERREAARAAREIKESATPGGEVVADQLEEPKIDYVALSDESRKLLNMAMLIIGIIGVWVIWSDVLPAFGILKGIDLWHHTANVDGVDQQVPITLADVSLAILILIGTGIATRRFPAFLEIMLLRHLRMTPGGRYATITLSRYVIVGLGIVVALGMIGGSWGQIQWLVAALGVGIGFGLQEIVANFICGLIILFERPIRVGDIVTVGDTDGVVTKIQIRATTIRNWDRKELLVPNKEFITQRLLNWSLSDQTVRLLIPVGVAYGSDVDKAMELMLEVAKENPHVIEDPAPFVTFESFGDNALALILRCYIDNLDYRVITISELHIEINRKFNAAGIVIAFPQRDVHLDTSRPLDIRIQQE
ncbi:MAG: mechanosensitive ion channel [Gammaproteobacteria bacterium]|nr:mechanosensitive ion channel [Gammaproteobacteria bacterium]